MSTLLLSAPHVHSGMTVTALMRQVIWALMPALLFGLLLFGFNSFVLVLASVLAALVTEALCLKVQKNQLGNLTDSSAILTALLLAMSLPPHFPWYLGAFGASLAVILGKQVYGGLGQNLFNPAMLARVILLISFPVEMTSWPEPQTLFTQLPFFNHWVDGYTGATQLGAISETGSLPAQMMLLPSLLGFNPGSLGESPLLLLLGGIWMIYKKVIDWRISVALILGCLLPTTLIYLLLEQITLPPQTQLLSGGLLLSAFFIATDPVTAPTSPRGRLFYGFGCGLLICVIRIFGAYPEGAAFAILLMNAVSPLIEIYSKQRPYGESQ